MNWILEQSHPHTSKNPEIERLKVRRQPTVAPRSTPDPLRPGEYSVVGTADKLYDSRWASHTAVMAP